MTATVTLPSGNTAVARGYMWECANANDLRQLNTLLDPLGALGSDPNPPYTMAMLAVKKLGAHLEDWDETTVDQVQFPDADTEKVR